MNMDLLTIALLAGLANWAFRALPVLVLRREPPEGGLFSRFLAATGPAAIATLFVASSLSQLYPEPRDVIPLAVGTLGTIFAFLPKRSVVVATIAGSVAYGLAFAVLS